MKKIFLALAVCVVMVACGGNGPLSMEERCDQYAKLRMELANEALEIVNSVDDYRSDARYQELKERNKANDESFMSWYRALSKEDKDKVFTYLNRSSYVTYDAPQFPN